MPKHEQRLFAEGKPQANDSVTFNGKLIEEFMDMQPSPDIAAVNDLSDGSRKQEIIIDRNRSRFSFFAR